MNNCLEIKTIQASAFKILVEALKEMLTDTCVEFDESGMKIVAMDTAHIVLVHLKLDASKFEHYYCEKKTVIGVNMLNLNKLIKTINGNDTLTLFMDSEDKNHLGIKIENGDKNRVNNVCTFEPATDSEETTTTSSAVASMSTAVDI